MKQIQCIIINNDRLNFKNSNTYVSQFLTNRLNHAGFDSIIFLKNKNEAEQHINEVIHSCNIFTLICDIMNPLIDIDLVEKMVTRIGESNSHFCISDGAIPGTQPDCLIKPWFDDIFSFDALYRGSIQSVKQRWHTQEIHNNQFNLYKYKRLKMFLGLINYVPEIYKYNIDNICSLLEDTHVFNKLISYFEGENLIELKNCPYCSGILEPLKLAMSQPFCGYLPSKRPYYFECEKCGLISLSPVLEENRTYMLYDEYDMQDFRKTLNNPYQKDSPRCNFSSIIDMIPENVNSLDLGGGVGKYSEFLKQQYPHWSVTHSDFGLKVNSHLTEMGICCRSLNFLDEEIGDSDYDIITAWEVIEHIPMRRFSGVISKIHRALKKGGFFIFSTPDFDSPLCQAFDFFGTCPPFHYSVFRATWLEKYFLNLPEWQLLAPRYNSDFLDDAENWFDYASKTSPSFQLRSLSYCLKYIFTSINAKAIANNLISNGLGTEVLFTVRKI